MLISGVAPQRTIRSPIHCTGVGVHTGVKAAITLRPAPVGTGIRFRRLDVAAGPVEIPALWTNADESPLCTTLTDRRGTTIMTIEHLMAALSGCAIDNCVVDIRGPEVPVMDGSAAPFVFLIECAGVVEQRAPRRAIRVLKPVSLGDGRASVALEPADEFVVSFEIDFASPVIGRQSAELSVEPAAFKAEISRARTFGFLNEVDALRAAGRALGASLDNAVVIDGARIVNEGGLRYPDEFVRHKVLDAVGDLLLAGAPLVGRFTGRRSSHALTLALLRRLLGDETAWTTVSLPAADETDSAGWAEPERARA